MEWFHEHYRSGGARPGDPYIAPLNADLTGFPPSILILGTLDPLLSDSEMFAAALKKAGVPVDLHVYEDGIHAFLQMPMLDMTGDALSKLAEFGKSMETRSRTWLARNVRQVLDGGERRFGGSRETVRSATSIPRFRSSPWILGAPHRGLAAAILLTRALIARRRVARRAAPGERGPVAAKAASLPAQHGWREPR
jgi:hypothetical protein